MSHYKPGFGPKGCHHYPKCPAVYLIITEHRSEEYDSDIDAVTSSFACREEHQQGRCTSPCRVQILEAQEKELSIPISHALWVVMGNPITKTTFVADIGS